MPKGVYKRTEYHKEICRKAGLGKTPWNKGLKLSDEQKKNMNPPHPSGKNHPRWGKKHSEKVKEKISKSRIGKGTQPKPEPTQEVKDKIRNTLRKGKFVDCKQCGEKIYSPPAKNKRFCSHACKGKYYSGENAPSWRGGVSKSVKTGYYSTEYKYWRKAVFEKDEYTCQMCSQHGGYLQAHHIKSFAKNPKLRFSLLNGMTLCLSCHRKIHRLMRNMVGGG